MRGVSPVPVTVILETLQSEAVMLETLAPLTRMLKTSRPVWEVLDIMEL